MPNPFNSEQQTITTGGRHGATYKAYMKATDDNDRVATKMTAMATCAAMEKLVAAFNAQHNMPPDQLRVIFVTKKRFAMHLNFQLIGTGYPLFLVWATMARGSNIDVAIEIPGKEQATAQQRIYCVSERDGMLFNSPMAVRSHLAATRPFEFEISKLRSHSKMHDLPLRP